MMTITVVSGLTNLFEKLENIIVRISQCARTAGWIIIQRKIRIRKYLKILQGRVLKLSWIYHQFFKRLIPSKTFKSANCICTRGRLICVYD